MLKYGRLGVNKMDNNSDEIANALFLDDEDTNMNHHYYNKGKIEKYPICCILQFIKQHNKNKERYFKLIDYYLPGLEPGFIPCFGHLRVFMNQTQS
jgi:hypothetical protein